MTHYIFDGTGALLSPCEKYRYDLYRIWKGTVEPSDPTAYQHFCLFIMLNPSKADGKEDDATIRRCVSFADGWGFSGLVVCNLFAYRATDPDDMKRTADPVGPDNLRILRLWAKHLTSAVCAWGDHGNYRMQDVIVKKMLKDCGVKLKHLGLTAAGNPKHPVRLAGATQLVDW